MKNRKNFIFLSAIAFAIVLFCGCSDDEAVGLPDNPILTLNTHQVPLMNSATSGKVELISNVSWMVLKSNGASWLTVTPEKGDASADAVTVTISAQANDSQVSRSAVIKFVHMLGEKVDSVVVNQVGMIAEPLRYQDSLALVALWDATKGPNWKGTWELENPLTEWGGVTVDLIGGQLRVTELVLADNGLVGSKLPEELKNLTELKKLVITKSTLAFELPAFLGEMPRLEFIALNENQHTGSIPESFYNLTNLATLHLYGNALTGGLSEKLGNLTLLEDLDLKWNRLSGPIPESVGKLTKLYDLTLNGNQFSGQLPASLSNCTILENVDVSENRLTGDISTVFDKLGELRALSFGGNLFTGDLPKLTDCNLLFDLRFSYCRGLTGSLPEAWADLDSLEIIQGICCNLSGVFPASYEKIEPLYAVLLDSNNLTGQVPEFTRKYQILGLAYNKLSGTLPEKFLTHNLNQDLRLSGNDLSGDVTALFSAVKLQDLYLADMPKLTGTLPLIDNDDNIYVALKSLNLSGSGFGGDIPGALFTTISQILNLSNCQFTGNLPTEIARAKALSVLKVNGNLLTGEVNDLIKKHANWTGWKPAVNICPQRAGAGLTNCE